MLFQCGVLLVNCLKYIYWRGSCTLVAAPGFLPSSVANRKPGISSSSLLIGQSAREKFAEMTPIYNVNWKGFSHFLINPNFFSICKIRGASENMKSITGSLSA